MSKLAILGASGHGKVIADTASLLPEWTQIDFYDDAWPETPADHPWPIIGNTDHLLSRLSDYSAVIIGIGNNHIRQDKYQTLKKHGARFTSIIHPSAVVSQHASLGEGTVVFAQAAINVHAHIGIASIINTGATVDHDCQLGDFAHISPGAHLGGNVQVAERTWIGIGSAVRQGMVIGRDVVVGAGSAVVKPVADGLTVAGTPAKVLELNKDKC